MTFIVENGCGLLLLQAGATLFFVTISLIMWVCYSRATYDVNVTKFGG